MKKKVWLGIGILAVAVICVCVFFFSQKNGTCYYSQIDNTKIEEVTTGGGVIDFTGGMPYSYTLRSYTENGKGKDITFGTSRQLKQGAFIRLTVVPVRGVIAWEEVQYDELPAAVQSQYPAPE